MVSTNQTHFLDLGSERNLYGISAVVGQTSFRWETSGEVAKCRLFSQANFFDGLNSATKSTLKVNYSSILFFKQHVRRDPSNTNHGEDINEKVEK